MENHYEAIAKIVGGALHASNRLTGVINSLISYFSSYDENFDAEQFRLDAVHGCYNKEEVIETIVQPKVNT